MKSHASRKDGPLTEEDYLNWLTDDDSLTPELCARIDVERQDPSSPFNAWISHFRRRVQKGPLRVDWESLIEE